MRKKFRVLSMADFETYPKARRILEPIAEVVTVQPDQKELKRLIPDFDAYFASLAVRADKEVLERAERLRAIATSTTGTDHIDLETASRKGVEIICIKEDYDLLDRVTATAELAWALMLGVVRKLPWGFESVKKGVWARDVFRGHQMSGKTFGILGYGRLGKMVADYAKAFRMRVIACDIRDFEAEGVERASFDRLLSESDVISIHIHLTEENRGLISTAEFEKMKPGVVIVNTSRGAIIDEEAFVKALESGKVGGAGLDVIHGEWREDLQEHPLIVYARNHENLLIMPHIGGITYESQEMTLAYTARKLVDYLKSIDD